MLKLLFFHYVIQESATGWLNLNQTIWQFGLV